MLLAEAADEEVVVTAGLVATGGGGVTDIKVARALSGPEAMRLFQKGGEVARGFKPAGQPARQSAYEAISQSRADGSGRCEHAEAK
jgi:hypothetical protein